MHVIVLRHWWLQALRAMAAIGFGFLCAFAALTSLGVMVALMGAYALLDAGCLAVLARARFRNGGRWAWLAAEASVSGLLGLFAVVRSSMGAPLLLWSIAAWAIGKGLIVLAGTRADQHLAGAPHAICNGLFAIAFGAWLLLDPGPGALAGALWIDVFATLWGTVLLVQALALRSTLAGRAPVAVLRVRSWLRPKRLLRGWS